MSHSDAEMAELCERLLDIVAQKFDFQRGKLRLWWRYSEELDGEDLDQAEFVKAIEYEFNVQIPDDTEGAIRTIGDSAKYIGRLLKMKGIDEYIDQRERAEFEESEITRRRLADARAEEYRQAGFFKKVWMMLGFRSR